MLGRVVLSIAVVAPMTPSDCLSAAPPLPGVTGYRRASLPAPRRSGAEEALPSSQVNLVAVPFPLRREVLEHPLQVQRCRPWPSPPLNGLGSSLILPKEVGTVGAAGFTSCCGPVTRHPSLMRGVTPRFDGRDLSRRRGPRYPGPWRLPGPDLHRLAGLSLSLGLSSGITSSLSSISARAVWAHSRPAAGRPEGKH